MKPGSLAFARGLTTARLSGLELPDAFAASTVAAAVNATERDTVSAKASRARAVRKAYAVSEMGSSLQGVTMPWGFGNFGRVRP